MLKESTSLDLPEDEVQPDSESLSLSVELPDFETFKLNPNKYKEHDHKQIALHLINNGQVEDLITNLHLFKGLDMQELANTMITQGFETTLVDNLDKFDGIDQRAVIDKIIECHSGYVVAINPDKFTSVTKPEIIEILLKARYAPDLFGNLEKYDGVDQNWIVDRAIANDEAYQLFYYMVKFNQLSAETAHKLIANNQGDTVARYLDKFDGIDPEQIAEELIATDQAVSVVDTLEKFPEVDQEQLAQKLIDLGKTAVIVFNLDKFTKLSANLAQQLIPFADPNLLKYLYKFEGINHQEFAEQLIAAGKSKALLQGLEFLDGIDYQKIADLLIADNQYFLLANNLWQLKGLNAETANVLIQYGYPNRVAQNLEVFKYLDKNFLARELLKNGDYITLSHNLENFAGLDPDIAYSLIAYSRGHDVLNHIDVFKDLDMQLIAEVLVDNTQVIVLLHNLEKFPKLSNNLAQKIMSNNYSIETFIGQLDHFEGIDYQELANNLILEKYGATLCKNLEKFPGLDTNNIANKLIDSEQGNIIPYFLEKFPGLDHLELARKLIDEGCGYDVASNLDKFNNIDTDIVDRLIKIAPLSTIEMYKGEFTDSQVQDLIALIQNSEDLADFVVANIDKFSIKYRYQLLLNCSDHYDAAQTIKQTNLSLLGISEEQQKQLLEHISTIKPVLKDVEKSNPYEHNRTQVERIYKSEDRENHPSVKSAKLISWLNQPETTPSNLREGVELINEAINQRYGKLRDILETEFTQKYGEQYTSMMLDGVEGALSDMQRTYRRLAAEYMVLNLAERDIDFSLVNVIDYISRDNLNLFLAEATSKFIDALKGDTKYYDLLYREWDHKRQGSLDFEEVFLGRDGVYAYVGRVGQIMARRSAIRMRNIDLSKTEQQILQLPTYLIYPRHFRDELKPQTKEVYLNQKINSPQSASYFDTGFTGTIPQDIMSILGISTAEMDSKIRLLSSNRRDRTVSGLEGNDDERHEIVNAIEYNVKPTETAAGLYYRQLPGQAEPTLEPYSIGTSAKERIQFQLIRQALYRHYFVREIQRLQYQEHILGIEDEEAVTKNGETLHIRHDPGLDAKSLDYIEEVFISENIGQTLQKKATAIKIADPTDPYPQEAVYEMVLPTSKGNKEVIVKAIVPSKSNGPLDEYAALKLLSSMGIQSAKPLARIFTPNSGLPGFIVMEKLPGVSGRLIFERLSEQGLSEAKIQSLKQDAEEHMQRIADKVRRNVGLDKPWRLKDFMIEFEYDANGEPVKIIRLIPIDFERVRVYDPKYPLDIKI